MDVLACMSAFWRHPKTYLAHGHYDNSSKVTVARMEAEVMKVNNITSKHISLLQLCIYMLKPHNNNNNNQHNKFIIHHV